MTTEQIDCMRYIIDLIDLELDSLSWSTDSEDKGVRGMGVGI